MVNKKNLIIRGIARCFEKSKADLLVTAGFLWLLPVYLLEQLSDKIINIHPALLPKYGGRAYGINVHKAVIAAD